MRAAVNHAHRPDTLAELLTACAFGALAFCIVLGCIVIFLVSTTPAPVVP